MLRHISVDTLYMQTVQVTRLDVYNNTTTSEAQFAKHVWDIIQTFNYYYTFITFDIDETVMSGSAQAKLD